MSFFTIFWESGNSFEGKRPEETVHAVLHRHWFVFLLQLASSFFMAIFFVIVLFVLIKFMPVLTSYGIFAFIIFLLFWWAGLFFRVSMYLLDIWIITDQRIIDNNQVGFFARTISAASLVKIQDVSVSISGFLPTMLDYGDVVIQTAGTERVFLFKQIPHPNTVRELIMGLHDKHSPVAGK